MGQKDKKRKLKETKEANGSKKQQKAQESKKGKDPYPISFSLVVVVHSSHILFFEIQIL